MNKNYDSFPEEFDYTHNGITYVMRIQEKRINNVFSKHVVSIESEEGIIYHPDDKNPMGVRQQIGFVMVSDLTEQAKSDICDAAKAYYLDNQLDTSDVDREDEKYHLDKEAD